MTAPVDKRRNDANTEAILAFMAQRRVATTAEIAEAVSVSKQTVCRVLQGVCSWSAASGVWRVRR